MVKADLKIIFFGNTAFSKTFLKYLHEVINYNVVGVVTDPDKELRKHGKKFMQVTPVKQYAEENNIPLLPHDAEVLKEQDANLYVVVAYKYLQKSIWQIPAYGTINIHPSLLPQFRGTAPIELVRKMRASYYLLGAELEKTVAYTIPGTDITHTAVVIRKLKPTHPKYPRKWAQIKKQPL